MLIRKWTDAVAALKINHIEEANRRTKDLLSSCLKQEYTPPYIDSLFANLAITHWTLGEEAAAQKAFLAAIAHNPGSAVHRFFYGCVCFEMKDFEQAVAAFLSCKKCVPKMEGEKIVDVDYGQAGLDFLLTVEMIEHNLRVARRKVGGEEKVLGIWRIPGLRMWEPGPVKEREMGW